MNDSDQLWTAYLPLELFSAVILNFVDKTTLSMLSVTSKSLYNLRGDDIPPFIFLLRKCIKSGYHAVFRFLWELRWGSCRKDPRVSEELGRDEIEILWSIAFASVEDSLEFCEYLEEIIGFEIESDFNDVDKWFFPSPKVFEFLRRRGVFHKYIVATGHFAKKGAFDCATYCFEHWTDPASGSSVDASFFYSNSFLLVSESIIESGNMDLITSVFTLLDRYSAEMTKEFQYFWREVSKAALLSGKVSVLELVLSKGGSIPVDSGLYVTSLEQISWLKERGHLKDCNGLITELSGANVEVLQALFELGMTFELVPSHNEFFGWDVYEWLCTGNRKKWTAGDPFSFQRVFDLIERMFTEHKEDVSLASLRSFLEVVRLSINDPDLIFFTRYAIGAVIDFGDPAIYSYLLSIGVCIGSRRELERALLLDSFDIVKVIVNRDPSLKEHCVTFAAEAAALKCLRWGLKYGHPNNEKLRKVLEQYPLRMQDGIQSHRRKCCYLLERYLTVLPLLEVDQ